MSTTPSQRGTQHRKIRLEDDLWDELGQAAYDQAGSDRSAVIRDLVSWWLRRPGAKMPARPDMAKARQ